MQMNRKREKRPIFTAQSFGQKKDWNFSRFYRRRVFHFAFSFPIRKYREKHVKCKKKKTKYFNQTMFGEAKSTGERGEEQT